MKTAVISGASAGLGLEFARQLQKNFPDVECLWLIARRRELLDKLAAELSGIKVEVLPLDLCCESSFASLEQKLQQEKPDVRLLVNNAGCGYLGNLGEMETATQVRMTELNVSALTAVTNICIPYMSRGGHIINISSIASFCPNPRMTVYSASKAYVSAFSRGIGEELKGRGVSVTAVCPGPMGTEFLDLAGISGNSKMFDTLPFSKPDEVVAGAYAAAKKDRAVYTHKALFKVYRVLAKILPQSIMVKFAKT